MSTSPPGVLKQFDRLRCCVLRGADLTLGDAVLLLLLASELERPEADAERIADLCANLALDPDELWEV